MKHKVLYHVVFLQMVALAVLLSMTGFLMLSAVGKSSPLGEAILAGLIGFAGAPLAVIALITGAIGLVLHLRDNPAQRKKGVVVMYAITLLVSTAGLALYTVPLATYAIRNTVLMQRIAESDAREPKTAEGWVAKYMDDYADVKKSVDTCDIESVTTRDITMGGTSELYLDIVTYSTRHRTYTSDVTGGEIQETSRMWRVSHEYKDQLSADIEAAKCKDPVEWHTVTSGD
jgi:hypothetical protein